MSNISQCVYPGCRDSDGNARLTRDVICDPSRRHYRAVLNRLGVHYVLIRRDMPPAAAEPGERVMRVQTRVYGHPAEWASDTARAIAQLFNAAHHELAAHLQHEPPPHPTSREFGRVKLGHHYLLNWFDQLCRFPAARSTAERFYELNRQVRRGAGLTDPRRFLPVPCPACNLLGLVRTIGAADGEDSVTCHNPECGEVIPSERYDWWTRVLLAENVPDTAMAP